MLIKNYDFCKYIRALGSRMQPFHLQGPKRGVTLREVGNQGALATVTETKTFPQKGICAV